MLTNQVVSQENQDEKVLATNQFLEETIYSAATACNNVYREGFDIVQAKRQSECELTALQVEGGLQAMVAAQMLAIHKLQQTSMTLANGLPFGASSQYYTNTAIKLSNTFIQQANLMAKLQGRVGQKIIVERVDVSHGGQAVIGTVNGSIPAGGANK